MICYFSGKINAMKKLLLLFSLLLSFTYGFGQHAVNLKKTASAMLQADEQKE